jgi:hypothetical protein
MVVWSCSNWPQGFHHPTCLTDISLAFTPKALERLGKQGMFGKV